MRNGSATGKYNAPGLPEILGAVSLAWPDAWTFPSAGASGCLYMSDFTDASIPIAEKSTGWNLPANVRMAASRSNSEYGNQPTVMPASADSLFGLYLGRTS